jgi:hypothetical protein
MFMFRLIVYFYDLRHDKTPVSVTRTLSLFLHVAQCVFSPVSRSSTTRHFRRHYYDDDAYRIYQVRRGLDGAGRHPPRFVSLRLPLPDSRTAEVTGPGDASTLSVSNFLLYLRISGNFTW